MEYKYHLQKYAGTASRHTCPACGRPRCFTMYVDDNNEPLDPAVGKCDHDSSCGYHYTPREYYRDHPDWKQDWREPKRQFVKPKPQQPKPDETRRIIALREDKQMEFTSYRQAADWVMRTYLKHSPSSNEMTKLKVERRIRKAVNQKKSYQGCLWSSK